ncbi:YtpR family tRNA-binding protein [Mesoplasma entomophilum]|uniref:YtpR family tRNA-binding protein n=1 Tax=Mesoplasma entomophilum TaxID=2149 RepID=UPI0019D15B44
MVGINIFNVKKEINKSFIINEPVIYEYINSELKDVIKLQNLPQFVIGKIIKCEKIPDTHLSACEVDIKSEILKIVCGARNAREGIYVVVATDGSWMPNGMQIVKGKLRGFDSEGMLCSAKELGIEEAKFNSDGIIELDEKYHNALGAEFKG